VRNNNKKQAAAKAEEQATAKTKEQATAKTKANAGVLPLRLAQGQNDRKQRRMTEREEEWQVATERMTSAESEGGDRQE
jgi:hypothetical protein